MKITCNTNSLNKAIQTVQRAISSKASTPIFSGIHILTQENAIEIQAMDMNMAISCTIAGNIQEAGAIVVSARHFAELIRKLQGEEITITTKTTNNAIQVQSGNSDFTLFLMNEGDYPKFPSFDGKQTLTVADETIKDLIKKTIFACANDESRPLFTGILVEADNEVLTFVGTNTHRLAIKWKTLSEPIAEPISMIIPAKVLNEISRNLNSDVPQQVTISLLDNQLMVCIDNVIIVSGLIEGKFPDYRRVIPPKFALSTTVDIKELAGAVERVALFSTDGDYSTIKFNVDENAITITSSSPEVGTGKETVACKTTGAQLNVAFNSKYILDILKNLEGSTATMSMNTSLSPVCITSAEEKDYTYIVTPVRVVF